MDPLFLRFLERTIVVLIGGMAIYLGFRLFLVIPEHRDSSGKVRLPWDISIVLTRVGPGVFFALFGVAAVSLSLVKPLVISPTEDGRKISYATSMAPADRAAQNADARALLRRDFTVLNNVVPGLRADLGKEETAAIARSLARAKLALMKPVWGIPKEGFGDVATFSEWVESGEHGAVPAGMEGALELYHYPKK